MNRACQRGISQIAAKRAGSQLLDRFFSLRGTLSLCLTRDRTVLSSAALSRLENGTFYWISEHNSASNMISQLQVSQSPNMSFLLSVTRRVTELLPFRKASHLKWHPSVHS